MLGMPVSPVHCFDHIKAGHANCRYAEPKREPPRGADGNADACEISGANANAYRVKLSAMCCFAQQAFDLTEPSNVRLVRVTFLRAAPLGLVRPA